MEHTEAGRWQQAADAFAAALELRAAPSIRYNLAAALVELGRHREAAEQLELVLSSGEAPTGVVELCHALARRIRTEAGRLRIELASDASSAEVMLDGEPVPPEWLAREIPVAPGRHTIVATRGDSAVAEADVVVRAGDVARVRLAVTTSAPLASTALHEDWRLWLGVGGGVVAVAIIAGVIAAVASDGGTSDAVVGNFVPGVITW